MAFISGENGRGGGKAFRHLLPAVLAGMAWTSFAGLVAKWDFNNYDPANPTATNVLEATVGGAGLPCYKSGSGTELVPDGTLGQMYVIADGSTDPLCTADGNAATAAAGLGAGNYAIAIPKYAHIALPIPDAVKDHVWTMKIRFYLPEGGKYHSFFNRSNSGDGDLFTNNKAANALGFSSTSGYNSAKNNYDVSTTAGAWHTLTVSAGEQHFDVFYDETTEGPYLGSSALKSYFNATEALTPIDGIGHLLLCGDNNGEDNLMYIDYVELYDEAGVFEGKLPHYTKAGLTGEWTFPAGNVTKATVGNDLVKYTRIGSTNFVEGVDGVLPGDGYVRAGQNNSFECYHGLTNNTSYTVVMDVRIPDNENKTKKWHSLFEAKKGSKDGDLFIYYDDGKLNLKFTGVSGGTLGYGIGEWIRVTITYMNGGKRKVYVNGALKYTADSIDQMKTVKGGCFLLLGDNNGEDWDVDISYAALYDRVLTAAEIAELHARPLAQRTDESFIPTLAPAGVWVTDGEGGLAASVGMPLAAGANGGYTWTRTSAPATATYVADLTLPAVQTEGGVLVKNSSGIASGIYGTGSRWNGSFTTTSNAVDFTTDTDVKAWGYYTLNTLDRASPHRVAVTWTASGCVRYYVDGRPWGTIVPTRGVASAAPSATMTFFEGLGATVTRLAAYDAPLTPDEIVALGGAGSSPVGAVAPNAPTVSATLPEGDVKVPADVVSFTVSATHGSGEYVSYAIDFGDGTGECTTNFVPSGTAVTFTHIYTEPGTFTPRAKAISQDGAESAWTSAAAITAVQVAASDVLKTWPWQQNVYTNRFTIMCEGVKDAADATRWDGLEVQYGANYENRAAMTRVESNGSTWIYKAQIVTNGAEGATIPYRLGYFGLPLAYENPTDNTAGTVTLWTENGNESFSCSIWGDNQQGARDGDWDSNKFQYLTNMFSHMVARGVDFGISSGDMASHGYYQSEIRPCILDTTDAILGRTRPYYVAWGNHDTKYANNKPYFETGSVNEPGYGTSESGNYYLYRGNVLFVFVDHNLMDKADTQTWLADLLATDRARNAKFRILVHHYPFWLECWGNHTSQPLLETAKAGGIDIVFSGHMHGYERIHKDGIVQVTNGGAGYLDHTESVEQNYGDATFAGGHKNLPYLWARQKSAAESGVLGPAEPVRMGCIQSYGELKVDGNVLTYTAHGFNADGSYIGVFDKFSITNTAFAANSPAATPEPCADPSAFAEFTTKPVTNAAWKDYKDAIGETFVYAEGKGGDPVVNVSKVEIEKFLAWLNGASGDYRLPTVGELETAFAGNLRREVAEWTASVDPVTGWCRILGSPEVAAEGTWARAADKPCIATAGCHANYLGFRLATGEAPEEPVDPASLDAALVALAGVAEPAEVYKWENGELVDVSSDWTSPSGDLSYSVPVVFTGTGALAYDLGAYNAVLGGGFAAQGSLSFTKGGSGTLTIGGEIRGGGVGWSLASNGALAFDGASYAGSDMTLSSGDRQLSLKGDNDFSRVDFPVTAAQGFTNYVASVSPATFRARSISNTGATSFGVGEGVSVQLAKDFSANLNFTLAVDGELDAEAFNMRANKDPWIVGSGTVSVGYFGTYENSWIRLAVSNVVFTTANPLRSNKAKGYTALFVAGDEVHLSSTCDWTIGETDVFGNNIFVMGDTSRSARPKLVIEGAYDAVFSPYATSGTANGGPTKWDLEMAGTGTLSIRKPVNGNVTVGSGTVKISSKPCTGEGEASASGTGKWEIDGTLALSAGDRIGGTFKTGGALSYDFGSSPVCGRHVVLDGCGLSDGDITVSTSLDSSEDFVVRRDWTGGDLALVLRHAQKGVIIIFK